MPSFVRYTLPLRYIFICTHTYILSFHSCSHTISFLSFKLFWFEFQLKFLLSKASQIVDANGWMYVHTLCLNKSSNVCMLNCKTFSHHKTFWAIYVIGPISKFMDPFSRNGVHLLASWMWCIVYTRHEHLSIFYIIAWYGLSNHCINRMLHCCGEARCNEDRGQLSCRGTTACDAECTFVLVHCSHSLCTTHEWIFA